MKIRFIQSLGGNSINYLANEKDKSGKYIWYDIPDYEAVRLIDGDIAVYADKTEYENAKSNYEVLEAQRKQAHEISTTLKNLDGLKADLESRKAILKELTAEAKEIELRIKRAEATIKE